MRAVLISASLLAGTTATARAQAPWLGSQSIQQQLAAGRIVVRSDLDGKALSGRVDAAVQVHADPQSVWSVLTDCEHAPSFIPGLKRCQRIAAAPDGSWELIAHDVKYSWLMPTIHSVFRADYRWPSRIDFQRVAGDLKNEKGTWLLQALPDGSGTVVEYQVDIDPGFWIPQSVIRRSLRNALPEALAALRGRVESVRVSRR